MEAFTNFLNLEANLNQVETKLKRLSSRAYDFMQEVARAEQTGKKKRKREVENWFGEVQQGENDLNDLKNRIQDDGLFRNLPTGESLVRLDARVENLMEQSQNFGELLLDDHESRGEPLLTTELFGDKFKEGLEKIWNWLVTDDLYNIGIYGQGGVGKTTLAKHIHNHLLEKTDFNVYWVTVSQGCSVKKLQDDIAKHVKLDLSHVDDEDRRTARLSRSLVQHSVLILDDVWEEICLEKIEKFLGAIKCRLILTTRSLQLCGRMRCQKKLKVATLDTNEAWDLFKHTLGIETVLATEVEKIAKSIARRCAGLPLGIITVAGSMIGISDIREWRNALEQLRTPSIGYKEMDDKVFPILEWSLIRLNGCERLCFLYCCLYPEDWQIEREELINLFILAELMPRQNTRELEVDHGHTILNKLIRACLLEETKDVKGNECVKMHDLIRDMALRITSGKSISKNTEDVPRFLVKSIEGKLILDQNEWTEDLNAVFFRYGRIQVPIGMSPKCPNLSTLLFSFAHIKGIPDSFFRNMDGLKVLNLKDCRDLKELPNCISDMVNLTALLLGNCRKLESVPPLGKLMQLRELDLSNTRITDVPQGLEELVKLQRLYMKGTRMIEMIIPKGTFSKLYHLQHLTLPLSVQMRDAEMLKQLQLFEGKLTFIDVYNHFIIPCCWPKCYNIFIVEGLLLFLEDTLFHDLKEQKALKFKQCNFQEQLWYAVVLPVDIQELIVEKCFGLSDVFLQRLMNRSKDLRHLQINDSEEVMFLLNLSPLPRDGELQVSNFVGPLRNLRILRLIGLSNLVGLINWGSSKEAYSKRHHQQLIPWGTFSSLTELTIHECHRLKKLFTVKLLQERLQNLQKLIVKSCKQLEEIAANDDDDDGVGEDIISGLTLAQLPLPKLRFLYLEWLPQLKNICKATLSCDSIEKIEVYYCPKVKRLPLYLSINNSSGLPSPPRTLEGIYGSKEWWESLEWDNPNANDALQPFFHRPQLQTPEVPMMSMRFGNGGNGGNGGWWESLEWDNPNANDALQRFFHRPHATTNTSSAHDDEYELWICWIWWKWWKWWKCCK